MFFHGLDVNLDHVELGGFVSGLSNKLFFHKFLIFPERNVEQLKDLLANPVVVAVEPLSDLLVSGFRMRPELFFLEVELLCDLQQEALTLFLRHLKVADEHGLRGLLHMADFRLVTLVICYFVAELMGMGTLIGSCVRAVGRFSCRRNFTRFTFVDGIDRSRVVCCARGCSRIWPTSSTGLFFAEAFKYSNSKIIITQLN